MVFRRVLGVLSGMNVMGVSEMRVVRRSLMESFLMLPCCFAVMARSVFVMFRRLAVMLCCCV